MITAVQVRAPSPALRRLAGLFGVEESYVDIERVHRKATADSLFAAVKALGAELENEADIGAAVAARKRELAARVIEPVSVAWDGISGIPVRLPGGSTRPEWELELESGETRRLALNPSTGAVTFGDGARGRPLPTGYHRLRGTYRHGGSVHNVETLVISAPKRMYNGDRAEPRAWGAFLPLYALQTERTWGSGDFTALGALSDWTAESGGRAVSTLPLFAAFLEGPLFEPSPYSPVSKLFWNEFYLDPTDAPEFESCPGAQQIVASADFRREVDDLRRDEYVDYRRAMALKRRVLAHLANACFASTERPKVVRAFVKERPAVEDYARFRAVVEQRQESWQAWPQRLREGRIEGGDYDEEAKRYHVYVQFLAHEQLLRLRENADARSLRLYFDLPLGVNGGGYDTWRERDSFATGLSGGAPPDAFFTRGQNWGFPPAHPDRIRAHGYRYLRAAIANILRYGRAFRMDHVMGLHHLYCIPQGMDATDGVYVKFPAEEQYAVLSVESHRNRAVIVGEDLGTVPGYVHRSMSRHAVRRTYVTQYEVSPDRQDRLPEPRRLSVAALNTHDMPPFAAFWAGLDIDDRIDLGLMTEEQADDSRVWLERVREAIITQLTSEGLFAPNTSHLAPGDVLRALLVNLARSRSRLVLTNLEDLWLETRPQNTPGTTTERINWRRKAKHTLEEMKACPEVLQALAAVDAARKRRLT